MKHPTVDAAAMRLFARQHNSARVTQLYELGMTKYQIANRVAKGIYTRSGHGVVSLTQPDVTPMGRVIHAVFIAGRGAAAALWTAAELHDLDAPRDRQLHVVVPNDRRRRPSPELYVHRTRYLPATHITKVNAIPTTSVPRTIVDCTSHMDLWAALRMLDSSSPSVSLRRNIHLTAERLSNGRPGIRAIVEATAPDGADRMRSTMERIAQDALRTRGLPDGEWNQPIGDADGHIREVDLVYRDARLIVEFDGLRFHRQRSAEQRDRATDRRLQAAGWRVIRFTWEDVVHRPDAMADDIRRALSLQ